MENYEQKYKEAIENFKKIKAANKDNKSLVDFIEFKYPELKESEDDRMKNEIIDFLRLPHPQFVGKRNHEEWIAWLEKQGERCSIRWSKEDDKMLSSIIDTIDAGENMEITQIYWLHSLSQKMKGNET